MPAQVKNATEETFFVPKNVMRYARSANCKTAYQTPERKIKS